MNDKFWNSEKLLSLSAILVSLLTLFVFMYQTNLIHKQQYRSVYPHLHLTNTASGTLEYQYLLVNEGIGPALIQKLEITEENGESYTQLNDYVQSKIAKKDSIAIYTSDIFEGMLIPAGKSIPLFGLFDEAKAKLIGYPKQDIAHAHKLRQVLNDENLTIKITYESIYGESWTISNDSQVPSKN